jgi:hypothetical protein
MPWLNGNLTMESLSLSGLTMLRNLLKENFLYTADNKEFNIKLQHLTHQPLTALLNDPSVLFRRTVSLHYTNLSSVLHSGLKLLTTSFTLATTPITLPLRLYPILYGMATNLLSPIFAPSDVISNFYNILPSVKKETIMQKRGYFDNSKSYKIWSLTDHQFYKT